VNASKAGAEYGPCKGRGASLTTLSQSRRIRTYETNSHRISHIYISLPLALPLARLRYPSLSCLPDKQKDQAIHLYHPRFLGGCPSRALFDRPRLSPERFLRSSATRRFTFTRIRPLADGSISACDCNSTSTSDSQQLDTHQRPKSTVFRRVPTPINSGCFQSARVFICAYSNSTSNRTRRRSDSVQSTLQLHKKAGKQATSQQSRVLPAREPSVLVKSIRFTIPPLLKKINLPPARHSQGDLYSLLLLPLIHSLNMIIDGIKMACEACIRGHRVSGCNHHGQSPFPFFLPRRLSISPHRILCCFSLRRLAPPPPRERFSGWRVQPRP